MTPESAHDRRWMIGVGVAVALFLLHASRYWHYVNDDAYITLRYSRFLATGLGPNFNPGEAVEGYTNFSWMVLLAGLFPFVGEDSLPLVAKALGVLAQAAALGATGALVRHGLAGNDQRTGGSAALPALAVLLCAASPSIALNSTSGLETGFFSLCLAMGLLAAVVEVQGGQFRGAAIWLGLGALTRPEGVGIALGAWALQAIAERRPRPAVRNAAILAAIVGGHLAFRLSAYDGEWLPNTNWAKQGGFWAISPANYVWGGVRGFSCLGVLFLAPGVGLLSAARRMPAILIPTGAALAGLLFPLATGSDWMLGYRLLAPYLPPLAAVVVICASAGFERWFSSVLPARALPASLLIAAGVSFGLQRAEGEFWLTETRVRAEGYRTGHEALASWLSTHASPGDLIATMDVGILGYRNPRLRFLDVSGLTDRLIAKSPGGFLAKTYDPAYVLDQKPRFIVLTYTADGTPYAEPPHGTRFAHWTAAEAAIAESPSFIESYRHTHRVASSGGWTDALADHMGAEAIFQHAEPGLIYLLVVFERS